MLGELTTIGNYAFYECINLASVTSIGAAAFSWYYNPSDNSWSSSLSSVTFAEGSNISAANFAAGAFEDDLRDKYLARGGGAGMYTKSWSTWTKVAGGENSGLLTVSGAALASHIAGLPANSAANPHTVKLDPVNITADGVMSAISFAVTNRYITLDLSACSAEGNTISSNSRDPGPNDMNLIRYNQYIVGIILPSGLTTIGEQAFSSCSSLASITIPASVTSIGAAFSYCANLRFTVTGAGSLSTQESGKMLVKNNTELITYPSASGAVAIPSGVTSIGNDAFYQCYSLTSVTTRQGFRMVALDKLSEEYLLTMALASRKSPTELISELVREKVAAEA